MTTCLFILVFTEKRKINKTAINCSVTVDRFLLFLARQKLELQRNKMPVYSPHLQGENAISHTFDKKKIRIQGINKFDGLLFEPFLLTVVQI